MKDITVEEAKNELTHLYENSFNSDDSYYIVNNFINNLEKENEELKSKLGNSFDNHLYQLCEIKDRKIKELKTKNEELKTKIKGLEDSCELKTATALSYKREVEEYRKIATTPICKNCEPTDLETK